MGTPLIVFKNQKLDPPMRVSEDGVTSVDVVNYAGLVCMAINSPPPGGFTPESNATATELYDLINNVVNEDEIQLSLANLNKVKAAWKNLRLFKRSSEASEVEAYINSL